MSFTLNIFIYLPYINHLKIYVEILKIKIFIHIIYRFVQLILIFLVRFNSFINVLMNKLEFNIVLKLILCKFIVFYRRRIN